MKSIIIPLNGKLVPLNAPKHAAAWALTPEQTGVDTRQIVFRYKKISDNSELTSLQLARAELPNYRWQAVSMSPYLEVLGGVEENAPEYGILELEKDEGEWRLRFSNGMRSFISSQRDIAAMPTNLPSEANMTLADAMRLLGLAAPDAATQE
jgi:hypothetical protein